MYYWRRPMGHEVTVHMAAHARGVAYGPRASLLALIVLALAVTGCESQYLIPLANEADFNRRVLQAKEPVLVDFHKGGGCPPCKMVLPTLDLLAKKYRGKVSFYSYELITMWFNVTSERLKQQYDIFYIPTVILFVDGKEVHRWPIIILASEYEKVIDEVLASRGKKAPAEAKPAAKPVGGPAKVQAAPATGAAAADRAKALSASK